MSRVVVWSACFLFAAGLGNTSGTPANPSLIPEACAGKSSVELILCLIEYGLGPNGREADPQSATSQGTGAVEPAVRR